MHRLSFCSVSEIEKDLFEMVIDDGITLDLTCAQEELEFWTALREDPFGVLLDCRTSFSYDYEGAARLGQSPLLRKMAILIYSEVQHTSNSLAMNINHAAMPDKLSKLFVSRSEALGWLRE